MKLKKIVVKVNDKHIFYLDSGSKNQVMVLLHGFPGNNLGLIKLAECIGTEDYRLIIPDLPACGLSDPLDKKHNLKNYSSWLNDFMESLSIDEAIIAGHSLGPRIALVFASRYPKKVKKLILITYITIIFTIFKNIHIL